MREDIYVVEVGKNLTLILVLPVKEKKKNKQNNFQPKKRLFFFFS